MKEKSSFTRKALEKIKSGDQSGNRKKGRRTGRIILILDALVIVLVLLFFFGRDPRTVYKSTSVSLDGIEYRLSVSANEGEDDIIFSLSLKNNHASSYRFPFSLKRGKLTIRRNSNDIYKDYFTGKVSPLVLNPGEIYTETVSVPRKALKAKMGGTAPEKKGFLSLFTSKGDGMRLNALAEIFLDNILTLTLHFSL